MTVERSQPFSDEAEKAVLSCLLHDPQLCAPARETIPVDALYHPANRLMYGCFLEFDAQGKPIEIVALSHFLLDTNQMDKTGGPSILAELWDWVPTPAHFGYYRGIVLDKWRIRSGIAVCIEFIQKGYELGPDDDVSSWTSALLEGAMKVHKSSMSLGKRKGRMFKDIGADAIGEFLNPLTRGMNTGFPWLDTKTGGIQRGRQWVISGGTSDGKSSLGLQIGIELSRQKHAGVIYSLEMPDIECWQRAACQRALVRSSVWQTGIMSPREQSTVADFIKEHYPIKIFDDLHDIQDICASLRVEKAERDIQWAMVDYLQLASGDRKDGREREVAGISSALKRAAMQLNIGMIVISQLNDDGKLRESRAIGQDADNVKKISTDPANDTLRILRIDKNRGGPRHIECLYHFNGEHFLWEERGEIDKTHSEPQEKPKWNSKRQNHRGQPTDHAYP